MARNTTLDRASLSTSIQGPRDVVPLLDECSKTLGNHSITNCSFHTSAGHWYLVHSKSGLCRCCFIAGWIVAQRRRRRATIHPSMARYAFAGHMYLVHIKSGFCRCSSIAGWMVAQRLRRWATIQPAMDNRWLEPEVWLSMSSTPFSGGEC